ncbi:DUF502 domain-containing protein [Sneathiella chungangensis]|uniref:DUF502 domain-containing protein n=1 Tax=Sneathiella chungangensis TaxID=1418234 RepID=A0A845M978_9PROT|nr:DUF502 domain-containing protein [Sneathiella chungangensis]MZR20885.1 DUF502 domain-containing protein [Sneathiella chungangensis]
MFKKTNDADTPGDDEKKPLLVEPAPKVSPLARLRTYFLTGIVVTAPIAITIYLTYVFVSFVDANITPLIPARYNPETYLPFSVPGLGVIIAAFALILIGFLTANYLGRSLLTLGERIVGRMPVVRTIYHALKQIMETVLAQSSTSFRDVVLLEYPRKGIWALAFVTSQARGEVNKLAEEDMISIFLPTTPNPTSGFLLFVPKSDLIYLDMSVEEGVKLVISAGMIWPEPPKPDAGEKEKKKIAPPKNGTGAKPKSA